MRDQIPSFKTSIALFGAALAFLPLAGGDAIAGEPVGNRQIEKPAAREDNGLGNWDISLGVGAGFSPRFEGSNRYVVNPVPFGSISYGNIASLGAGGLSVNALYTEHLRAGLLLGYGGGRDSKSDIHLRGLGNIVGSAKAGGFVSYNWDALELRAEVRQAVTMTKNGLEASLGANYAYQVSPRFTLTTGAEVDFADGDYMKRYFGVSPAQSAASHLRAYKADGGVKDVSLSMLASYRMTDHWGLFGLLKVSELVGDAGKSPIVQSKEQFFGGVGVGYHF